jgi:peptidoglycan-associated lipoprotein
MLRLVFALTGSLTILLLGTQPADACGVKLAAKAPKVQRHADRTSNPVRVLVLNDTRTAGVLDEVGHEVDQADRPGESQRKNYRIVVASGDMKEQAEREYPDAQIVDGDGTPRRVALRVEDALQRRPVAAAETRTPTTTAAVRTPRRAGTEDGRDPLRVGGGETEGAATATPPAAAGGDDTPPVATPTEKPARPASKPVARTEERPADVDPPTRERPAAGPGKWRVFFPVASADLTGATTNKLDRAAKWLASNPGATVTIEGHASATGPADANMRLSERRAEAAKDYLVEQGVSADRISTEAFGMERPEYQPASSGKNRRVVIKASK